MSLYRRPLCILGMHVREGRKVYYDNRGIPRTVCKGCGRPMHKTAEGWRMGKPEIDGEPLAPFAPRVGDAAPRDIHSAH